MGARIINRQAVHNPELAGRQYDTVVRLPAVSDEDERRMEQLVTDIRRAGFAAAGTYREDRSGRPRYDVYANASRKYIERMLARLSNPSREDFDVSDLTDAWMAGVKRGEDLYRSTGVSPSKIARESADEAFSGWWEYGGSESLLPKAIARGEWLRGFRKGRPSYSRNPKGYWSQRELEKKIERLEQKEDQLRDEAIRLGRGRETLRETAEKDDPLSKATMETYFQVQKLRRLRDEYFG